MELITVIGIALAVFLIVRRYGRNTRRFKQNDQLNKIWHRARLRKKVDIDRSDDQL